MPAYIDFKTLAESIDIQDVARSIGLAPKKSGNELRAPCPACNTDDHRALAIMPESNSYRCYAAPVSGDCISLYAHINGVGMYQAAKALQEQFSAPATAGRKNTAPQEPSAARTAKSQPGSSKTTRKSTATFDPEAFAAKLSYSPEVKVLGISEEDAVRLGIGFYSAAGLMRGRVCLPIRYGDGSLAGYVGWDGQDLKVPDRWLSAKIVPLRKRA